MRRRKFLLNSTGLIFSYVIKANSFPINKAPGHGRLVSPYMIGKPGHELFGLILLDLDKNTFKKIETPFAIHKVSTHESKPEIGYGIASYSSSIAKIDLKQGSLLAAQELNGRFSYSGHSLVSKDGTIYASVSDNSPQHRRSGIVTINPKTLAVTKESIFSESSKISFLHDLQFSHDEQVMIASGGNSLVFFDVKSLKIIKSHSIAFDIPEAGLNHFAFTKIGDFGIQSNVFSKGKNNSGTCTNPALVLFEKKSEKFKIFRQTGKLGEKLKYDLFGFCLNANETVLCIASLWDNYLTFWDMSTGKFIKGIDCKGPTGVTLTRDKKNLVVTTIDGLKYFDSASLKETFIFTKFNDEFTNLLSTDNGHGRLFHSTAL